MWIHKKLRIIKWAQMTASGRYLERERRDSIFTRTDSAFDANTLSHDISTPGFLRCTAALTWAGSGHVTGSLCKLTHRSGACRPGRTEPPEPSISRAGDPETIEIQQKRRGQHNHSVQSRQQNMDPNTQRAASSCHHCPHTWTSARLSYHKNISHIYCMSIYVYNCSIFTPNSTNIALGVLSSGVM